MRKVSIMSLKFVSTMSLEFIVNYALDWFTFLPRTHNRRSPSRLIGRCQVVKANKAFKPTIPITTRRGNGLVTYLLNP